MKQRIFMIVFVAILCLCFAYLNAPFTAYSNISPHEKAAIGEPLLKGDILKQTVLIPAEAETPPSMVGFRMDYGNRIVSSKYTAELLAADGTLLNKVDFNGEAAKDTIFLGIPGDYDARGKILTLQLSTDAISADNALSPVTEPLTTGSAAQLTINDQSINQQMSLVSGSRHISSNIWLVSMLVMIAAIVSILLWNQNLARNVLLVLLIFGILFSVTTPILDTPDEQAHLSKSMMMANGDFFVSTPQGNAITTSYNDIYDNIRSTLADTTLHNQSISSETAYTDLGSTMLFTGYLPQALALGIAKLFHFDILPAFYLGRILNLVLYAVLAWLAVKMAKKFKLFLAVISMMPMALYISGSYNPDATLYGLSLVLIAYFINMFFDRTRKITYKEILIFAVICVLISMKKYNYAPFLFLLLFIPKERYSSTKTKYLGLLLTFAIVAAAIMAMFYATTIALAGSSDALAEGGINAVGANMYDQLRFMIANKGAVISMFITQLVEMFGGTLEQLFTFGWLSYSTPSFITIAYFAFIAVVAFCYTRYEHEPQLTLGNTRVSIGGRIGILLIMLAITVISYLMMYLASTPVGLLEIWGMQGRYLVPIFALLPFIGQNVFPLVRKDTLERSTYNILFIAILFIVFVLLKTTAEYY
ncbi:MAG: DUF2142 domain-containing protein [Christensenella sp.]|nr:DUF2142 domain-containing protein [Christensenella sp.]